MHACFDTHGDACLHPPGISSQLITTAPPQPRVRTACAHAACRLRRVTSRRSSKHTPAHADNRLESSRPVKHDKIQNRPINESCCIKVMPSQHGGPTARATTAALRAAAAGATPPRWAAAQQRRGACTKYCARRTCRLRPRRRGCMPLLLMSTPRRRLHPSRRLISGGCAPGAAKCRTARRLTRRTARTICAAGAAPRCAAAPCALNGCFSVAGLTPRHAARPCDPFVARRVRATRLCTPHMRAPVLHLYNTRLRFCQKHVWGAGGGGAARGALRVCLRSGSLA
jgi:hypothetical protein